MAMNRGRVTGPLKRYSSTMVNGRCPRSETLLLLHGNSGFLVGDHHFELPRFQNEMILRPEIGKISNGDAESDGLGLAGWELDLTESTEAFDRRGHRGIQITDKNMNGFSSLAWSSVGDIH